MYSKGGVVDPAVRRDADDVSLREQVDISAPGLNASATPIALFGATGTRIKK